MSAEQKREMYLKLNESEYMVKYKYEYITYEEARLVLDFLSGKSDNVPDVLIKKDDWADYRASKKKIALSRTFNSLQIPLQRTCFIRS